jgi:hypothetical protein
MDTNKTSNEAGVIEQDKKLENELSSSNIDENDIEFSPKPVRSILETWAGNFGTSQDRKRGKRELFFVESLDDMSEQVSDVVEAFAVMSETLVTEGMRGNIANGFCIIASLISEAASQTIRILDHERNLAERENRKLREELKQAQNHSE